MLCASVKRYYIQYCVFGKQQGQQKMPFLPSIIVFKKFKRILYLNSLKRIQTHTLMNGPIEHEPDAPDCSTTKQSNVTIIVVFFFIVDYVSKSKINLEK